jgi:hypothetical protein
MMYGSMPVQREPDSVAFPDLGPRLAAEWQAHGVRKQPEDEKPDQMILHVDDHEPWAVAVGLIDAALAPRRSFVRDGKRTQLPAFNVTFAGFRAERCNRVSHSAPVMAQSQ